MVKLKITKIEVYPGSGLLRIHTETREQGFTKSLLGQLGTKLPVIVAVKNNEGNYTELQIDDDFFEAIEKQKKYFENGKEEMYKSADP